METNKLDKSKTKNSVWLGVINICEIILMISGSILSLLCAVAIIAAIDKIFDINCFFITFLLCGLLPISLHIINYCPVMLFVFVGVFVVLGFSFWKTLSLFLVSCFLYVGAKFRMFGWIIIFIPLGIYSAYYVWNFNWIISIIIVFVLITSEILINHLKDRFSKEFT